MKKIIRYSIISSAVAGIAFFLSLTISYLGTSSADISKIIAVIKDLCNVVFWIVSMVIVVLSYIHAKKSLFAPIKTEIFKLQIKEIEKLVLLFRGNGEVDLRRIYDIENILYLNAGQMIDQYLEQFFPGKFRRSDESREKTKNLVYGSVISQKWAEENLLRMDYIKIDSPIQMAPTEPALILAVWMKYDHGKIDFTEKYANAVKDLDDFLASPILPQGIKDKVKLFKDAVDHNIALVGIFLTKESKKLPTIVQTAEQVKKIEMHSFMNGYNDEINSLVSESQSILSEINRYLKVNSIIE